MRHLPLAPCRGARTGLLGRRSGVTAGRDRQSLMKEPDYSAGIDELIELGLTHDQAEDVWVWYVKACRQQMQTTGGVVVIRLLSYMLDATSRANLQLRLTGLAFGTGLGHLTGHKDMSQAAAELGVSHQAVELAAKKAAKAILG